MLTIPEFWRWRPENQFKVILSYTLHNNFKACLGYKRPKGENRRGERNQQQ